MMEENILDLVNVQPFDDTDELDIDEIEYQPPPTKRPTSIRLGPATQRQLTWLEANGHGKQSEIIALAVDRMWVMEQGTNGHTNP